MDSWVHFLTWTKIQMSHRMLISPSRAAPSPFPMGLLCPHSRIVNVSFLRYNHKLPSSKNTLFLELHFVQNVYNVYIKTHTDPETCDARVDWIYLTITIRGDVVSCSLVGRFQLSEKPATHTFMAEKWICHIQGAVDWTKQLSSVFHKKWRISWRAARLPVSQECRSSMQWVSCFCNLHAWVHNLHPTTSKSEKADKIHTFRVGSLAEPKSFKFCCVWINMIHSTS